MSTSADQIVCIVDDDKQVRSFLVEALGSVGVATEEYVSGDDFMRRWRPGRTGCVLLDIRMPRVTGPEVHDWLRQQDAGVAVIFLSGYADVPTAVRAMRLGAFDFLEKPFSVQQLIERVNEALRSTAARRAETAAPSGADEAQAAWRKALTPREGEVLEGIVAGKRNKVIAIELGISERTVETHRASIMTKAGARSAGELITLSLGVRPPAGGR